ncbi:MAG: hypothetical protein ACT4QD_10010 [Acidobacteriota bacterium]
MTAVRVLASTLATVVGCASAAGAQPELIERTLAIVGGQVLTLSDLNTALALRLVEPNSTPGGTATERLIDRLLVLREVERYAPPEPGASAIQSALAQVRRRFPDEEAYAQTLREGGFTEERVRGWVRDDLRIRAYLDQRFAAVTAPTDDDVAAFYRSRPSDYQAKGVSVEAASPQIRELLSAQRRQSLISDWIADLRRRTTVIELWRPPPGPIG